MRAFSFPDEWKHVTFTKSDIAIMTDPDNTAESATAIYGDITFRKRNPDSL